MTHKFAIIGFTIGFVLCLFTVSVWGKPGYHYLKAPEMTWHENRFSGHLENVPMMALLEELSLWVGFDLVVVGDLNQKISLSVSDDTAEEIIKKIKRQRQLNYIIIFDSASASQGVEAYRIQKLIVYVQGSGTYSRSNQRGKRDRSDETPDQSSLAEPDRKKRSPYPQPNPRHSSDEPAVPDSEVRFPDPDEPPPGGGNEMVRLGEGEFYPSKPTDTEELGYMDPTPAPSEVQFEGNINDLTQFVETLSDDARISSQEYEIIMEEIVDKKNMSEQGSE